MSFFPGKDPLPGDAFACDAIERVIVPRTSDLGGFSVRRALPTAQRRMVGPFIFLDHRVAGEPLHGLQCWVALPAAAEEGAPAFVHHGAEALPTETGEGKTVRVAAGSFLGTQAPAVTGWATPLA